MAIKKLIMLTAIITGFGFIVDSGNCNDNIMNNFNTNKITNNKFNENKQTGKKNSDLKKSYIVYEGINNGDDFTSYDTEDEDYGCDNHDENHNPTAYDNKSIHENEYTLENNNFPNRFEYERDDESDDEISEDCITFDDIVKLQKLNRKSSSNSKTLFEQYEDIINNEELYSYDMASY